MMRFGRQINLRKTMRQAFVFTAQDAIVSRPDARGARDDLKQLCCVVIDCFKIGTVIDVFL